MWGENPGLQVGDMASSSSKPYDGKNLKKLNTLASGDLSWINKKNLNLWIYFLILIQVQKILIKVKLKFLYLGWFFEDWSMLDNAQASILYGLKIRKKEFKNYGDLFRVSSTDEDWVTFNQLIKYYKFGFGRATEYLNEEIRRNKISRNEAAQIITKYDGKYSNKIINDFCRFIEITPKIFWSKSKKLSTKKFLNLKIIK